MSKTAYVTGGMGGIGTAICRKFHSMGYKVIAGCGPTRDHAKWLAEHKQASATPADDPNKVWTEPDLAARGEKIYAANCVACHQANGKGVPNAFPALDGSKIVNGPVEAQIELVLHGKANTAMPSWKQLSNTDIAAVITYTRNAWGNRSGQAVQPSAILAARGK